MIVPGRIPTLAGALLVLALAAWVLWLGPRRPLHRALALFLGARGVFHLLLAFSITPADLAGRLMGYAWIALPFAAANFGAVFLRDHGPRGHRWPWLVGTRARAALFGLLLAAETVYFVDHSSFVVFGRFGPLFLLAGLSYTAEAALALALAVAHARSPPGTHRSALLLAAVGLAVEPAYRCVFGLVDAGLALDAGWIVTGLQVSYVVTLALLAAIVPVLATRGEAGRQGAERFVLALAVPALAAVATWAVFASGGGASGLRFVYGADAAWDAALALLVAYSVLRYRLFGIDLGLRWTIERGTVTSLVVAVLFVVTEGTAQYLGSKLRSSVLGVLAAGTLLLFLTPLQRWAHGLADRALPGVAPTPAYEARRAHELYQYALEAAAQDGVITLREREVLVRLQDELRIDAADALRMETEALGARALRGHEG